MVGLLVAGLIAYPLLPVASLPNVNYPTLSITAQLPGADPQTMASTVASPLELQFGEIPGLTQMTSRSEEHTSELQSRQYLVCRLLLEKKKNTRVVQVNSYRSGSDS